MYIIGERINGMFVDVRKAIQEKDAAVIRDLAQRQQAAAANALDCNVGPASPEPIASMRWLVECIREVSDLPIALDSTKPDAIRAGLEICGSNAIINSTTGEQKKMDVLFPMAAEFGCQIIGLTIDEQGVPAMADGRLQVALKLVMGAMTVGLPVENLFVDAVILPVSAMAHNPVEVMKAIQQTKALSDPPPKTIIGLSNVSQTATNRELINRTYLTLAQAVGLDAAIADPLDTELMDAMITGELLLNRMVYCDDFLRAYRK
jgi:5-methyltetrahydrofolate corrinoid/iron sulfur protein methyltransferase